MTIDPLAGISLIEATQMLMDLERSIMTGSLSSRYSDGTSITYRSFDEMERTADRLRRQIDAAGATDVTTVTPIRAFRITPYSGWR